ncbi:MAG: LysM peptidoglycan-binding domain-containing protein [Solirubrobacterales bacterium]
MEASSGNGENGPASWTARVLAPFALVAVALVVVLVVSGSLGGDDDDGRGDRERAAESAGCEPADERAVEQGFYVLKSGENLSSVAAATCITPDKLARLNPNLDPQLLPISACVDLVPDGCKALAQD